MEKQRNGLRCSGGGRGEVWGRLRSKKLSNPEESLEASKKKKKRGRKGPWCGTKNRAQDTWIQSPV